MRKIRLQRLAPVLVVLLVALLAGLSVGSGWILIRHFRSDAVAISRLYSGVFGGLNNSDPSAATDALIQLGEQVRREGIPLIVTDASGRVTAAANLPFKAPLEDPRVATYAEQLDRENPPIVDSLFGTLHYGTVPTKKLLTVITLLQALTLAVIVAVGVVAWRNAMAAQRDRLWVAMAREAAHQMGTPLMSLEGWIEHLRTRSEPTRELASHLEADAERLERVAQRFERIGHTIRREDVPLGTLAEQVAAYFRPRLPQRANPITLAVERSGDGPVIAGDRILLEWALESLIKNAIDALQGREGRIVLRVGEEPRTAWIRVVDDGPGVPTEMHPILFEPGISTKSGGWGIGLALARRVVEDSHGGELLLEATETGASFLIRIPIR